MSAQILHHHEHYREVVVTGEVTVAMLQQVLAELAGTPDFLTKHVMWSFGEDARPPAFHEFEALISAIDRVYTRAPKGKRVALVVPSSFARSVAAMFRESARQLPLEFAVFAERGAAEAWLLNRASV